MVGGFPGGNLLPKDNGLWAPGKTPGCHSTPTKLLEFSYVQPEKGKLCQFFESLDGKCVAEKVAEGKEGALKFKARIMKCHWSPNRLKLGGVSYIILDLGKKRRNIDI